MSDEQDKLKLSLEPPKLFGRKKKSDAMGTTKTTSPAPGSGRRQSTYDPAPPAEEETAEVVEEPVADEPVIEAEPEPVAAEPVVEPEPAVEKPAAQAEEPPLLPLYPAAALTGLVTGAAMVVLIWLSLRGCEAVRGTSSCTGGPGFLLLVATFVLCVLLGSTLLKTFSIPDPGSSSFLAIGLVSVASLLFLIDVLDHWSMLIVIPITRGRRVPGVGLGHQDLRRTRHHLSAVSAKRRRARRSGRC